MDLYPTAQEKAANLLYFVTKNHSFSDGNKRIAATMFLYFLDRNGLLYDEVGEKRLDDRTLVALTIMIAELRPEEKETMISVIMNCIGKIRICGGDEMRNLTFVDCVDVVGTACPPFPGTKKYVSTGAIDIDHIVDADTETVDYAGRPSRANLVAVAGDVLFAKMQGTKKTLLVTDALAESIYSTGFCAVRPKKGILTERCLYHLLTSQMFLAQKDKHCSGATQKAITNAGLEKIVINVPNIEEQETIADLLDAINRIISQRQRQLRTLDTLIKARFVEMFGDPSTNDKDFATILGSDSFKLSNGKFVPESKRFDVGIPVYGGNGVSWYTDEVLHATDTIVVGRVGFQSGNVHLVKGPLWISDNAMYISDIWDSEIDLRFLYHVMEHIDFTRFQDAGDLKKITQKPFMMMQYIKPPIDMQLNYISFVSQVDKSKVAVQAALDKAQLLFDSLMQQYFG